MNANLRLNILKITYDYIFVSNLYMLHLFYYYERDRHFL